MENAEQEFVSVVREYERVIYKVCYLYTTPNATLNDLYQEVVLNLWKAFPKFRRECKISTWIYRIALNTCISFIRKEKNIPEIVTLTQEADRTEETDETQAMLRQLYRMINRLGQLEKSIILLYLERKELVNFTKEHGLTGWAPTQGHIPSGVPYIGFAREDILSGKIKNAMIIGKGSLFLGRMTNLFDGVSFVIHGNTAAEEKAASGVSEEEVKGLIAKAMKEFAATLMAE